MAGCAYTLTFAVFLITGARLGDIFGRRRLFLVGSAGFTAASAACALAPSPTVLIAMRVLQGAFGAVLIPQGFGMLKEVFSEEEMPKVFGLFGPVMGLAAVGGPILAGALVDADLWGTGWRMVFLINVPLGLLALAGAARFLPRTIAAPGARLDAGGMALVGAAAFALIYPLIEGRELGWPWWSFAVLAAGVALLGAFVAYERRRREAPLIELSLLRNRSFTSGLAVALAFFAAFGGVLLVLSLFCQLGERFSPARTGLALAPLSIGMVVAMPVSFALVERIGRVLIHAGIAVAGAGLVVLAAMVHGRAGVSAWTLTPGLVVAGVGTGLVFGQLFDVILAGVGHHETGSASGVLNAIQQLSFALGVAGVGTVFFALLDGRHLPSDALTTTALLTLVPLAAAFALAFRLPPRVRADA
ncbi:MAG: MFS transporter [Solirubrobacteraceae bacterium]